MSDASSFKQDENGATLIEYGLIASLIALALSAGVQALGISVQGLYQRILDVPI